MADPAAPVVEAAGVTKRFGSTTALDDARIAVAPGTTHALVGRNGAGKSTLVSVLTGLLAPDAGTVAFGGRPAPRLADRDAWRETVACVYQQSTVIPSLSVAENLFLGRHPHATPAPARLSRLISWGAMRRQAREVLERWGVAVDVRLPAADLTVEQRQFVEIARALSFGARFIVLDEPTARLDGPAIARLFTHLRDLQRQGVTVLFISHHLQEVFEVCDTVTVFRDARHIATRPVAGLSRAQLVSDMTGEADLPSAWPRPDLPSARPRPGAAAAREADGPDGTAAPSAPGRRTDPPGAHSVAPPALEIRALALAGAYRDITLTLRPGEIVGLAGAASSGRTELAETVAGIRTADHGSVHVAGTAPRPGDVRSALRAGVGFVPQDRHRQGFVPLLSVAENATLAVPEKLGPAGTVRPSRRDALTRELIRRLDIKTPGPRLPVDGLSGGNQQKVVLARALAGQPRVLVLISPTAGVDVRSKETLLRAVADAAAGGTAVLIASDEVEDLRGCGRVAVMFGGRVVAEHPAGWRENVLVAAMEGMAGGQDGEPGPSPAGPAAEPPAGPEPRESDGA